MSEFLSESSEYSESSELRKLTVLGINHYPYKGIKIVKKEDEYNEDDEVTEFDCDFISFQYEYVGTEIITKHENGSYVAIRLFETYSADGWRICEEAKIESYTISSKEIREIEYIANDHLTIDESDLLKEEFNLKFCKFSSFGYGDSYYPQGYYHINYDYFTSHKKLSSYFISVIKHELLDKILNPDRLENLADFCNKELEYLGRDTISTRNILENF